MAETAFSNLLTERTVLSPDNYALLLRQLLDKGRLWGKTAPIHAHSLEPKLVIVTTKLDGQEETRADILTSGLCLVFDAAHWPDAQQRRAVVRDIFISAAYKLAGEQDWNAADWRGADVWTQRYDTLISDYAPDPSTPTLWRPRPDAARLVLPVSHALRMPVPWGTFDVDAGGHIALRQRDIPALQQALTEVATGRKNAEDALYTTSTRTGQPEQVSAFDVFGMYPGFLEKNYVSLELVG